MLLTLVAFVVALGLLVAIHEFGHYRMAKACGVRVLRFSVGFGKPLLRWQPRDSHTEYLICAFPLGGFVKMLDEREAPVAAEDLPYAFNRKPLWARALIVLAGPVANLLLAIFLYASLNWNGVQLPMAILSSPTAGSLAERAGIQGGERVSQAGFDGEALRSVDSLEDLRWLLTRGALESKDVRLLLRASENTSSAEREVFLPLAGLGASDPDEALFARIGITGPYTPALIGEVTVGGPAQQAGLRAGDLILKVGESNVVDGRQLREMIRSSVSEGQALTKIWTVKRADELLTLSVTPNVQTEGSSKVGKISAYVGANPKLVTVQYGFFQGLGLAIGKTWDVSVLTLRMMGRMVIGEASLKNLSGPLTIADYAGKSASMGLTQYIVFLALISVSLGVLNLLPLPVLDGGHLMYYLWEGLTGKSVSDRWMERFQRGGVAVLMLMMSVALFNDVSRIAGF